MLSNVAAADAIDAMLSTIRKSISSVSSASQIFAKRPAQCR